MSTDFGALPPEINSGRMYTGAGSAPMLSAASAWEALASQLHSAATSYRSVISELAAQPWQGPASASMAAAAAPHAAWMHTSSEQARHAASQARSAAAAYEQAFAATVPPPMIAENQARSRALEATNLLGQNTQAIATNQAHYGEMWAQDTATMYNYAGITAAATKLTPFNDPHDNSNSAGPMAAAAGQSSGDGGMSSIPNLLNSFSDGSSGGSLDPSQWLINMLTSQPVQEFVELNGNLAPVLAGVGGAGTMLDFAGFGAIPLVDMGVVFGQGIMGALTSTEASAASSVSGSADATGSTLAAETGTMGLGRAGASAVAGGQGTAASLGRAASVGALSVPQTWGSPPVQLASTASPLPQAGSGGLPETGTATPAGLGGIPPIGSMVNASQNSQSRPRPDSRLQTAMAAGAGAHGSTSGKTGLSSKGAPTGRPLSTERGELNQLRKTVAQMKKERDSLKRSAASILINDATEQ